MSPKARRALLFTLLALLPASAIWCPKYFVTQDGPAHLYNANILLENFRGSDSYASAFAVRQLTPNLAGHLMLSALMTVMDPFVADRFLITLTSLGFAASILLLRSAVGGFPSAGIVAGVLTLSMNRLWLLGFYNFLCGSILFALTLAFWWHRRERFGPIDSAAIAVLFILGFFCHPVSCGATILVVMLLALFSFRDRGKTTMWTFAAVLPLTPLLLVYHRALTSQGRLLLDYGQQDLSKWLQRLHRIKFLSLASTRALPFSEASSPVFFLLAPSFLLTVGVVLLVMNRNATSQSMDPRSIRAWGVAALFLLGAAVFGPPSLGPAHGDFLRERLFALGVVAAIPLLPHSPTTCGRVASVFFFAAFLVQSCYVWEYGIFSTRRTADLMDVRESLGKERSILGHIVKEESKFRASPDQHALTLLGVDTGSVIWNNYEADLYYFPVRFREPLSACDQVTMNPLHFVNIDGLSERRTVEVRAFLCLVRKNRSRLDTLVVQGLGDQLDPWLPGWRARRGSGDVRIYQ